MAETSHFPAGLVKILNLATVTGVSLQGKIYLVRLLFCLTTLVLLAVNDAYCRGQPGDHLWLLAGGVLYPTIGQLLFGRLDVNRRRGHVLFLADGMFVGAVMAALEFALLPSVVLIIISLFNWVVVGGVILLALGIVFMFLGMLTIGSSLDMLANSMAEACHVTNWIACLMAIGYFVIVARIIHKLMGALRLQKVRFQAQSDSASSAKAMAEQALLAVLPASAAQQLAKNGEVATEALPAATVLLMTLQHPDGTPTGLETMQDVLLVCDSILARHGIELIKSFGKHVLACGCKESGPDDAVNAFLEIDRFFQNHESQTSSLRGILHHGPITLGLVHPQRLSLDLFGPSVDELDRLSNLAVSKQMSGLIVSAQAFSKLRAQAGYRPAWTESASPICYRHASDS